MILSTKNLENRNKQIVVDKYDEICKKVNQTNNLVVLDFSE